MRRAVEWVERWWKANRPDRLQRSSLEREFTGWLSEGLNLDAIGCYVTQQAAPDGPCDTPTGLAIKNYLRPAAERVRAGESPFGPTGRTREENRNIDLNPRTSDDLATFEGYRCGPTGEVVEVPQDAIATLTEPLTVRRAKAMRQAWFDRRDAREVLAELRPDDDAKPPVAARPIRTRPLTPADAEYPGTF